MVIGQPLTRSDCPTVAVESAGKFRQRSADITALISEIRIEGIDPAADRLAFAQFHFSESRVNRFDLIQLDLVKPGCTVSLPLPDPKIIILLLALTDRKYIRTLASVDSPAENRD